MTSENAHPEPRTGLFLSAEWRRLLMLSYEIDPDALRPLVPRGVELDTWDGRHLVSMVAFQFLDTRLLGVPVPFHRDFDEINLRFYVRRRADDGWRRGVVFVKEIVPRWALATVARVVYGEKYVARPMRHRIDLHDGEVTPDVEQVYGRPFAESLAAAPFSAFVADGSPVVVRRGARL
ncbi:DUF2071 domain-containing protein [Promicromonospora sp. NPDC060204]|uniref:DUF2071 domain-containing protein n=1 Tax=Promicromonospora sp. NPDC060204 TaxID=3347071 RepID=UPI0036558D36